MHPLLFPPSGEKSTLFKCNSGKYQSIIAPLGEMSRVSGTEEFSSQRRDPLGRDVPLRRDRGVLLPEPYPM
jgi:hypothetical protein